MRSPREKKSSPPQRPQRKPYAPPRLREYGTLARLVRMKGTKTPEGVGTKAGV